MASTKKAYVLEVTNLAKQNAKQILAGHGLPSTMVQMISERADIIGKIATFAYSTVNAKKGAKSLVKTSNFKIGAYPNFNTFNGKARNDIEKFMLGLSPEDQETFSNANNIITIIALPDTESGDTATDVANGKSVVMTFDKAVTKEYKLPGASYITIMFGDSVIRPAEAAVAVKTEKINKKKVARKTPAKIKSELTQKAKAKLAKLKVSNSNLNSKAGIINAEMNQFSEIAKIFGVEGASAKELATAMKAYTRETKAFLSSLSPEDKKYYKMASAAKAKKNVKVMNAALFSLSDEVREKITSIVRNGNLTDADSVLKARKNQIKLEISALVKKNEELIAKAESAPTSKLKANINFAIRKNADKIKQLKAKINLHSDLGITAMKNRAALLAKTNADLQANRLAGMSINDALNAAIAALPVEQQVKQQIKQQTIQQIAAGVPEDLGLQSAMQQVMQQVPAVTDEFEEFDSILDGNTVDVFGNLDEESTSIASSLANSAVVDQILSFL